MDIRKPKPLRTGDTVGLVSVSSPVAKKTVDKSVEYLTKLGYSVELGRYILQNEGYMAGTVEQRASDLNEMFRRDDIKAVFCAYGGTSANQILPYIDYDLIRTKLKIFVGLSDSSILATAIYVKCRIVTFHGPTGYNFGEAGMTEYTERHFLRALCNPEPLGEIEELSPWITIRKGSTEGEILGGNLSLLQSLVGTVYEPDWENKILFWEDLFVEYHTIDLMLTHLDLVGVFRKIKGMVIGNLLGCKEQEYQTKETFEEVIRRILTKYDFPILHNVDLGHTDDKITIPIGTVVRLDLNSEQAKLSFIESATME